MWVINHSVTYFYSADFRRDQIFPRRRLNSAAEGSTLPSFHALTCGLSLSISLREIQLWSVSPIPNWIGYILSILSEYYYGLIFKWYQITTKNEVSVGRSNSMRVPTSKSAGGNVPSPCGLCPWARIQKHYKTTTAHHNDWYDVKQHITRPTSIYLM